MISLLKAWFNLYSNWDDFLSHKTVHFIFGFCVGSFSTLIHHRVVGMIFVLICGILKEIFDHYELLKDPTNTSDQLKFHILDVIVTVLGGVFGLLICLL